MILKKTAALGIVAIVAVALVSGGCSGQKAGQGAGGQIISVKGEFISPVSKQLTKTFTGSLEGEKQADITAKISEAVEKINVREGDNVRVNDIIVNLDRTGPTSSYMQASSVFKNSEKNYYKMKTLYEQGAISESQYDGARTDYEVAEANFRAAEQMVDLRSPISGTVTSVSVSPGQYVSPGTQVATVALINKLRMKFGVSISDIGYFETGADVEVTVEADSLLRGLGRVVSVAHSADPVTRVFQVEVEVDNGDHLFKPGMFARCDLVIGQFDNVLIAPRTAILNRDGKNYAFIFSDGKALIRVVEPGADFNGVLEIKSGLHMGDTLIIVGQDYVANDGKVKLVSFIGADGKEVEL